MNEIKRLFESAALLLKRAGLMTVVFSATSTLLVAEQLNYTAHPDIQFGPSPQDKYFRLSLWKLNERAAELARIKDPAKRDERCIPVSAFARRLDEKLHPDARIFINGVLGSSGARETTYFFLRNYLFPRDIEISLDGQAVQTLHGFAGVPCNSREYLRDKGYDVLVRFGTNDTIVLSPLTPKGVLSR